jgi:hypothetical protein
MTNYWGDVSVCGGVAQRAPQVPARLYRFVVEPAPE